MQSEDMVAAAGHSSHTYAAPPHAPRYSGGGHVSSYNRRGSYSQASEIPKPSIYGSRYAAPEPVSAPAYRPAPVEYAPVHRYPAPELSHGPRSYGPQTNAYSEQSRHASHDPHYDAAKDPVSQYAEYVPVFEYGPKSHSSGNELSIYGYRK